METSKFIFSIDAEKHFNVIIRIIMTLNRQRVAIKEFSSLIKPNEDMLRLVITFEESRDNAVKLSKRLTKEIDIISFQVFEQML